jgi:protein-tyrosine phosphatase
MKRILFVCLGNICRSPAAETILKEQIKKLDLQDEIEVDSAGIGAWHVGQLPDKRMRDVGARYGYDINSRARQVKREDFSKFNLIIGMDRQNVAELKALAKNHHEKEKIRCLGDYICQHPTFHEVPDPYYGDEDDFLLVISLLEDACQALLDDVVAHHLS